MSAERSLAEVIETLEGLIRGPRNDDFDRGAWAARLDALDMLRPLAASPPAREEAPAEPSWRGEYNRVEAIREAAEGQDRIARSTTDPIAKSDAETQAAGHWSRYEREVAKLNKDAPADPCAPHKAEGFSLDPCCPHCEAPAEGAREYLNPGDLFWGVCRAGNIAANAVSVLRTSPEKVGLVIDALDRLKAEMDSVINDPSYALRNRTSEPEAGEGEK